MPINLNVSPYPSLGKSSFLVLKLTLDIIKMKLIFSVVAVLALCGTLTHSAAVNDNDAAGIQDWCVHTA